MAEQKVRGLGSTPELRAIVARLVKQAAEIQVKLPADAALYVAQKFQSNARELRRAFMRLFASSAMTGTEITLGYTQRVLQEFIQEQSYKVAIDSVPELPSRRFGTKAGKVKFQDSTWADCHAVVSLLKIQDGIKVRGVRHQLEVNMRECERDGLARRDSYERNVELRIKKRKLG